MDREVKLRRIAEEVERVQVTLGAPKIPKQRELQAAELVSALEMFLLPDIEQGITRMIRTWDQKRWPMPAEIIGAVRGARKMRVDALPPEQRPVPKNENEVCRCGATPRWAQLEVVDQRTGEAGIVSRIIAPCNAEWHRKRGQGFVPLPENFAGWVDGDPNQQVA